MMPSNLNETSAASNIKFGQNANRLRLERHGFLTPCQLIAHRGLSGLAPENSLAAIRLAAEAGYFGIEVDVHTTKDSHFVIFHDQTLNRMTGIEAHISEMIWDRLKDIRLANGSNVKQYPDEKIPLLDEFLAICEPYGIVPVIEIKQVHSEDHLDRLVERLQAYRIFNQAIIISFHLNYLVYLRKGYPNLAMQLLVNEITPEVLEVCVQYGLDVDVNHSHLTTEQIQACHAQSLKVNVWTVDDLKRAQDLIDRGVDYITTNCLR